MILFAEWYAAMSKKFLTDSNVLNQLLPKTISHSVQAAAEKNCKIPQPKFFCGIAFALLCFAFALLLFRLVLFAFVCFALSHFRSKFTRLRSENEGFRCKSPRFRSGFVLSRDIFP